MISEGGQVTLNFRRTPNGPTHTNEVKRSLSILVCQKRAQKGLRNSFDVLFVAFCG